MKTCTKCKFTKSLDDYYTDKKGAGGYRSFCKSCHAADEKRYRESNPEKNRARARVREAQKQASQDIDYYLKVIYDGIKQRCTNPNHRSYATYNGRWINDWKTIAEFRKWALISGYQRGLTIDRIDEQGPYSRENCRFITPTENYRKGALFYKLGKKKND